MNQNISNKDFLNNPIFICGHRKSGTTMLVNLFDGISDSIVYPDDSGLFYLFYPRYDSSEINLKTKLERLSNTIIKDNLQFIIDKIQKNTDHHLLLTENRKKFSQMILEYKGADNFNAILKYFISCFHDCFYKHLPNPKCWIEKTTSTEIYALELIEIFPNAKFIHLIRDPRDNWASLKSGWDKKYQNHNDDLRRLKQSMLERAKLGFQMAKANLETIGKDHYKIIKFEDLTSNPLEQLKSCSEFLGLKYQDSLLTPSIFGSNWGGNNFEGHKFKKASNENVGRWKERISENDAQLIEFHFNDVMDYFGYNRQYSIKETQLAATQHYKWFNFSTPFSAK